MKRRKSLHHNTQGSVFITFEGIDGCGKSTQADLIQARLEDLGLPVARTFEPGGGSALALHLRQILNGKFPIEGEIGKLTEAFLMSTARIENLQKFILPNISEGKIVISDRFYDSTSAFQGWAIGEEFTDILNHMATGGTIPDLTVILFNREGERFGEVDHDDRFERDTDLQWMAQVQYMRIVKDNETNPERNILALNCWEHSLEEMTEIIWTEVVKVLKERDRWSEDLSD